MSIKVRAHFDGKAIIPDEPVNLPINARINAELEIVAEGEPDRVRENALRAWEEFKANPIRGLSISDDSLRRENLYEERL